jgi:hypothetical protein
MHAPLLSSLSPTRRTGVIVTDVWVPAYHLAKAVGIYGGTTPRAGSVRRIGPIHAQNKRNSTCCNNIESFDCTRDGGRSLRPRQLGSLMWRDLRIKV